MDRLCLLYDGNRLNPEIDNILRDNEELYTQEGIDFYLKYFIHRILYHNSRDGDRKVDYYWLDRLITVYNIEPFDLYLEIEGYVSKKYYNICKFLLGYKNLNLEKFWIKICKIGITDSLIFAIEFNIQPVKTIGVLDIISYTIQNNYCTSANYDYIFFEKLLDYLLKYFDKDILFNSIDTDILYNVIKRYNIIVIIILVRRGFDINNIPLTILLTSTYFSLILTDLLRFGLRMNSINLDNLNEKQEFNYTFYKRKVFFQRKCLNRWIKFVQIKKRNRINIEIACIPELGIDYFNSLQHFAENA